MMYFYLLLVFILSIILIIIVNLNRKEKKKLIEEIDSRDIAIIEKSNEIELFKNKLDGFSGIVSIESEIEDKRIILNDLIQETQTLDLKYIEAKSVFNELTQDVDLYKNNLEFINLGVYEPIFDFESSDLYIEKLSEIVNQQKELIKSELACVCNTKWIVENSTKKGAVMTRRYINLTLRAFNGECDSLISKVRWNNVKNFEERIKKSFNAINKFGESNNTFLTDDFLKLKIDELNLTYELELKKQQEKEEQRAIREEQREEEKAQREFEKVAKEAEIEELRFEKALARAQKELGLVSGEELEKLNRQIALLKQSLVEAQEAKQRAISRAQETKSGHVYIISNIGSFGEDVYKIGMTRRLEPMDRVKELGDASVPFRFDLHAMIFTENAPELESLLQKEFHDRRVNKVNHRKEYFRVTLDEIEKVLIEKYDKDVNFIKISEAQEYRETHSILKRLEEEELNIINIPKDKYPDSLFKSELDSNL